jgi:hypothetical protein
MAAEVKRRRSSDSGWLARSWDWIDDRDIDKHAVSLVILGGTAVVTRWAMNYAEMGNRPGLEVAAIIAAVTAPYMALQAAAVAFYFKART